MPVNSQTELIEALTKGDPKSLIGSPETIWLDFKTTGYSLGNHNSNAELVKDVTALANAKGGYLVLGVRTEKDTEQRLDKAVEIRPIRMDTVDFGQYRSVIAQHTYPPLRDVEMRWWCEADACGIATIYVPPADEMNRPVLTTLTSIEGYSRAILFGVFVRGTDSVDSLRAGELHSLIQQGRILRGLGDTAERLITGENRGVGPEKLAERLRLDLENSGLMTERYFFLQAWPLSNTEVREMHLTGQQGLRNLLARPPHLRYAGFNLTTDQTPTLLEGGGLRTTSEKVSVSLEPSGLYTAIVSADTDFLAWADLQRRKAKSVNETALVEVVYEFCAFFANVVLPACQPIPDKWTVVGGFDHLRLNDEVTTLEHFVQHLGGVRIDSRFEEAPADRLAVPELTFDKSTIPEEAAFRILSFVYRNFGVDETEIPYTADGQVSTEKLIGA